MDGDVTKSILTWRVRREDSGRSLLCRVSNPWFAAYTLEDSVLLDVLCEYKQIRHSHLDISNYH